MFRVTLIAGLCVLLMNGAPPAPAATIDNELQAVLSTAPADQSVSVLVYLADRVDVASLDESFTRQRSPLQVRHEVIVRALQEKALGTQGEFIAYLNSRKAAGAVKEFTPFWIVNAVAVEATPDEIDTIARRNDVGIVFLDYQIELVAPENEQAPLPGNGLSAGGVEIGIEAVRAPEVWDMGITGDGILVASLDTGVDGDHPALESRWRGLDPRYANNPEWAWFDPVTNTTFPRAFGSHGTHTMGSVCGGAPGDQIGVAPGAQWMHAAVIDRESIQRTITDAILSFQWMLDPDGDPNTNWDVPHSCSNSWGLLTGHGVPPCDQTFWEFLDACEAAGIVIIFSAGNEGGSGLRRPADRATDDYRTLAVAAVDANRNGWPIAGFSSRGPTFCTPNGNAAIKPDIAAPGVDVRSAWNGGGYRLLSGTSMSSPHINGAVALIRQANPDLGVNEVKQIIYDTAFDLGANGEDNSYGWGMLDCFEAVQMALGMRNIFLPEDFNVIRGNHTGGELADLFSSDDSRLVLQPGLTQNPDEPPVWVELTGTAPTDTPSAMSFLFEGNVNTPGVTQTISLFDYVAGQYEEMDSRAGSLNVDESIEIVVDGDPSRFVNSETLEIKAELTWKPPPLVLMFPWSVEIDQAVWAIDP